MFETFLINKGFFRFSSILNCISYVFCQKRENFLQERGGGSEEGEGVQNPFSNPNFTQTSASSPNFAPDVIASTLNPTPAKTSANPSADFIPSAPS